MIKWKPENTIVAVVQKGILIWFNVSVVEEIKMFFDDFHNHLGLVQPKHGVLQSEEHVISTRWCSFKKFQQFNYLKKQFMIELF